jgi:hypothetical protein
MKWQVSSKEMDVVEDLWESNIYIHFQPQKRTSNKSNTSISLRKKVQDAQDAVVDFCAIDAILHGLAKALRFVKPKTVTAAIFFGAVNTFAFWTPRSGPPQLPNLVKRTLEREKDRSSRCIQIQIFLR